MSQLEGFLIGIKENMQRGRARSQKAKMLPGEVAPHFTGLGP
jgi:hypothetical protein